MPGLSDEALYRAIPDRADRTGGGVRLGRVLINGPQVMSVPAPKIGHRRGKKACPLTANSRHSAPAHSGILAALQGRGLGSERDTKVCEIAGVLICQGECPNWNSAGLCIVATLFARRLVCGLVTLLPLP